MVLILIKQIIVMLAMMSVGVVLYKIKAVDETGVAQLSNIALYVATPCVVLRALAIPFDAEKISMGVLVMLFFLVIFAVSVVIARFGWADSTEDAFLDIKNSSLIWRRLQK